MRRSWRWSGSWSENLQAIRAGSATDRIKVKAAVYFLGQRVLPPSHNSAFLEFEIFSKISASFFFENKKNKCIFINNTT
jgi:hypothetical protein